MRMMGNLNDTNLASVRWEFGLFLPILFVFGTKTMIIIISYILFTKDHHCICITMKVLVVVAMWLGDILLRDQHHRDGFFNRCRRVKDDADL